jgi:hypothetical protein
LFDGKIKTIWSYSLFNEAQDATGNSANMNYIALGNEFNLGKFRFIYDFKWSDEQLDRTGIVSETVPDNLYPYALANTRYIGHWMNFRYRVTPKVDLTWWLCWTLRNGRTVRMIHKIQLVKKIFAMPGAIFQPLNIILGESQHQIFC